MFTTLLSESRTSSQNSEGMDEDESMVDGESTQHCAKLELHREIEFHTISSIISSQPNIFSAEESQTWKLLICLFDKLPLNAILKKFDQDVAERFLRKDAISRWLIDACAASVNQDLLNCKTIPNRIYLHLTGRKIAAAVKECLAGNDFRLSTVLAQLAGAGSNVSVNSEGHVYSTNGLPGRVSTKKQLNVESITYDLQLQCQYWTNNQQFKFMNEWYQSIWKLIGGDVSQWNEKVFIKSLDWKRTLGLFFWYSFGGQSTLKDSILQYETNFNVEVIKKPTPHYLKGNLKETVYDINYHLLKLHEFDDYALEEMLEPKTYSSYLDYRQSWLIGYLINLKDIRRYKDEQTIDKQTMNLVLQLEMMGDWKWAVFVSLYLTNAIQREKIVRLLISIWYPITDHSGSIYYDLLTNTDMGVSTPTKSDIYSFLVDDLSIPSIWIHESRALKAKYGGSLLQYCICLIDSEQFELAYTTLLTKIVHSRILTGKLKFVCKILESLPKNDIPDWNIGGAIILKYYQPVADACKGRYSFMDKIIPFICSRSKGVDG
ncbi:nuclear protein 96-domain-containing protein [Globomyces pollinis-pini]|nr:nuclear protein 96-domain-containing protein [Globomyces pollinis-pini]